MSVRDFLVRLSRVPQCCVLRLQWEVGFREACGVLDRAADKKLFEVKRKDQMNALKNLIELNDVNQQYKIIDIMLKGLFKVSIV